MLDQLTSIHPLLPPAAGLVALLLAAIVAEFGLRLYQKPAGSDFANLK